MESDPMVYSGGQKLSFFENFLTNCGFSYNSNIKQLLIYSQEKP